MTTTEQDTPTTTVYVSIGNSDDKLCQTDWSTFAGEVVDAVTDYAEQIYGVWYSEPSSAFQNACIAATIPTPFLVDQLRTELTRIRTEYHQDSVAWAEAPRTEFI